MRKIVFLLLSIYCMINTSYASYPVDSSSNTEIVNKTDLKENLEEKHAPYGYLSFASAITSSILYFTTELYIIAFSFGILAVIFGAIGLKKKPKALAIVGIILGLLEVIIPVFILLALLFIIDQVN